MDLILLGAPGSGKGTQARRLCQFYSLKTVSMGDLFRKVIKESNSPLSEKIQTSLKTGTLVDDKTTLELLKTAFDGEKKDVLLDGYPRNLNQARHLFESNLLEKPRIVFLDVELEKLVSRLCGRRVHEGSGRIYHIHNNPPKTEGRDDLTNDLLIQREDDTEGVIQKRFSVYQKETLPLWDFYQKEEKEGRAFCVRVNAEGDVEKITENIIKGLSFKS